MDVNNAVNNNISQVFTNVNAEINGKLLANLIDMVSINSSGASKSFSAAVINSSDDKILMKLPNGQAIEAKLDKNVDVKSGDVLNLKLVNTEDNKIELKIVSKQDGPKLDVIDQKQIAKEVTDSLANTPKASVAQANTPESIKENVNNIFKLLENNNIDKKMLLTNNSVTLEKLTQLLGTKNVETLKSLILNDIPITKENLLSIMDSANVFTEAKPSEISFLAANNIEINQQNLSNLRQLEENKMVIGKDLQALKEDLNNLVKVSAAANPKSDTISNGNFKSDLDAGRLPEKLSQDIPNLKSQEIKSPANNLNTNTSLEQKLSEISNKHFGMDFNKAYEKVLQSVENITGDDIKNSNVMLKKFSDMLQEIKTTLNNENVPEQSKAAISNIANNIASTCNFMDKLNENYLHLLVPVMNRGESNTAQIYVKDREIKKKLAANEPINIFFALDTNNMGNVKINMSSFENYISLDFILRDKGIIENFKAKKDELIESLKETSLNLTNIKYDIDKGIEDSVVPSAGVKSSIGESEFDYKV